MFFFFFFFFFKIKNLVHDVRHFDEIKHAHLLLFIKSKFKKTYNLNYAPQKKQKNKKQKKRDQQKGCFTFKNNERKFFLIFFFWKLQSNLHTIYKKKIFENFSYKYFLFLLAAIKFTRRVNKSSVWKTLLTDMKLSLKKK